MEARRNTHREQDYCAATDYTQERTQILGELAERRRHARLSHHFSAKFCKVGLYSPVEGVTENVGPFGAFIKLNELHAFQLHDQIILTLFIPPSFSGQEKTIGLQGPARIIRLVGDNEGVAVKFSRPLKQFERTNNPRKQLD
ncbi:MAG: hypothetical protein GWN64_07295 [Candidatus Thorarchaeota archaeon]|nr:hypothetical protein [Candidatus Thorarchaeota archaeon]